MRDQKRDDWMNDRKNVKNIDLEDLFIQLKNGNRSALSKGITLVESNLQSDRVLANALLEKALPFSGNSIRIGITGVPGVGKSTFIEAFGKELLKRDKKIAILAIDPSSSISGGSILGDKTRMNELSVHENVFIRPTAAGNTLGGVGRSTREAIFLCEASGYDVILIETVGVGQSETTVKSMVDFFLLLMLSGAGDELQGIKKGIMEMADALVVTKADGDNKAKANLAAAEYRQALHLFPENKNGWTVPSFTCSSLTGDNIQRVWEVIESFENQVNINGWKDENRKTQNRRWLSETLDQMILADFYNSENVQDKLKDAYERMESNQLGFFQIAEELYQSYLKKK